MSSQSVNFKFNLTYFEENNQKLVETIHQAIDYLNDLNEPSKIFKFANRFNALIFIGKTIYHNLEISYGVFAAKHFDVFMAKLMLYLFEIHHELDLNIQIEPERAEDSIDNDEKRILLLSYLLYIINIITRRSKDFCVQFVEHDGLKACLLFLSDDKFIRKNRNAKINNLTGFPLDLINYVTLNILNLSIKTCEYQREIWLDLESVKILLNAASVQKSALLNAYWSIVYIVSDQQIENLKDIYSIVNLLVRLLIQCNNDMTEDLFDREDRQIEFNGKILDIEVHVVKDENFVSTSLTGLLECLYKLSLNEKLKSEIYVKHDIKHCLKSFLSKGNVVEIYFTLKLLVQLSFSPVAVSDLVQDAELMITIKRLSSKQIDTIERESDREISEDIKTLLEQLKWNLNENSSSNNSSVKDLQSKHILISCDTANTDMCVKVKEKLQSLGHKVMMPNSNLEEMARLVENASVFIMIITEKYRQSISCQIEAKYAFKLNKKIIPLIMSNNEHIKGWIGLIVAEKTQINFSKVDFDECMSKLNIELESFRPKQPQILEDNKQETLPYKKPSPRVLTKVSHIVDDWTDGEVKEWFAKNNINMSINEYLRANSGKILKQMYSIKKSSAEFFYQSLKPIVDIEFHDIVLFASCLDDLFAT